MSSRKNIIAAALMEAAELARDLRLSGRDAKRVEKDVRRLSQKLTELEIEERNGTDDT